MLTGNKFCWPMDLAELRELREEFEMTIDQFEDFLGLPLGTIREWEAQERFNAEYGMMFDR